MIMDLDSEASETIKDDSELENSLRSITSNKKRTRSISSSEGFIDDLGEESQLSSVGSRLGSPTSRGTKKKVKSSYTNSENNKMTLKKHRKPGRPPKKQILLRISDEDDDYGDDDDDEYLPSDNPTKSKRQIKQLTKQQPIPIQPARKRGRPAGIKNRVPMQQHDNENDDDFERDLDSQIIHRRNSGKLTVIEENDVFAKDNAGQTNLHRACQACSGESLDMVKALINGGADVNVRDNAGLTPLHEAVNSQNYEVVKYLLEAGANPNVGESDGVDTPLHDAVNLTHEEIVSLLIDYGGDPDKMNLNGITPKMLAADEPQILPLLKSASKVKEPNSLIVRRNTEAKVSEESRRISPGEAGKILHRKSSLPSHPGRSTRSTKTSGKLSDRSKCSDSLRNNGARGITSSNEVLRLDLSIDSKTGRSRLHHYSKLGHAEAVVGILEMDSSLINHADKSSRRTSLHEASIEGHHEIIGFLLAYQANINAQDKYGNTPLHYASFYGHADVIKLLLEHNTALKIKNEDGRTPLDMARGRKNVIQLLCQALNVDSDKYLSNNITKKLELKHEQKHESKNISKHTESCEDSEKEGSSVRIDTSDAQSETFSVESEKKNFTYESIYNVDSDSDVEPIYQESDGNSSSSSISDTEESQPKTPVLKAGPIYAFQFDPKIDGYPLVPYTGNEDARFVIDIQIERYLVWDRGSLAKKINRNIAQRKVTFDEKRMLWPLLNKEIWRDSAPESHSFENIQTERRSQFDKWELHFIKYPDILKIISGPWEGRQIGDLKIFPIDIVSNDGNIDDAEESDC